MLEDEIKIPIVDVIASGYEWKCPRCKEWSRGEYEYKEVYTCDYCNLVVKTNPPEHCYG